MIRTRSEQVVRSRSAGLAASVLLALVLGLVCLVALLAERQAAAGNDSPVALGGTPQTIATSVATTPSATVAVGTETPLRGWEEQALRELADRLGWPMVVVVDGSGRYIVQLVQPPNDWAQVTIRPFEYEATAEIAFSAEQEDARVAGFELTRRPFLTYPAYWATLRAANGSVIEQRLRWRVERNIMGVSLHGVSPQISSLDPESVGLELLLIAARYGLPLPAGGLPSPVPPTRPAMPTASPTPLSCSLAFSDVPAQYWAHRQIMELACAGVVSGYSDGTFRPDGATTRAQLVKMIVLSQGWPLTNPIEPTFADVNRSHIFYPFIETAFARGIISGYENRQFRPDLLVTRAQVAKILVRSRGWSLIGGSQSAVALCDVPQSHWAWAYIQTAIQRRAFSGYSNGCFLPDAYATRAQIAKVIVNGLR